VRQPHDLRCVRHPCLPCVRCAPGQDAASARPVRASAGDLRVDIGVDVRDVVAGEHVLEPHQVVLLDSAREPDGGGQGPARAAVEREADPVAEGVLHRGDALQQVAEPSLGQEPAVGPGVKGARHRLAVVEVGHLVPHGAVEGDALLDDGEALRQGLHPAHLVRVVLRRLAREGLPQRAIVDAHAVADFPAEKPVNRQPCRLARDVPQRHLDRADRRAVRLEGAALADLQHGPLDECRILPDQGLAEVEHEGLEVRLVLLDLAVTAEAFVRDKSDDWILADDGATEVDDLHVARFRGASDIGPPGEVVRRGSGPSGAICPRGTPGRRGKRIEARRDCVVNIMPPRGARASGRRAMTGIPQADARRGPSACQGTAARAHGPDGVVC
jgi:hypothetical protein